MPVLSTSHHHMTTYPENSKFTRKQNDFSPLFTAPHKNTHVHKNRCFYTVEMSARRQNTKQAQEVNKLPQTWERYQWRALCDITGGGEHTEVQEWNTFFSLIFVLLIVPLGPTFLSNVGMEGNERTHVHVGCANHVYHHPHSKETHIWNCVQKADKSVLVAAKWWARLFSGERKSLDDGRRFCVFAASRVLKGIESIEDWMRAN